MNFVLKPSLEHMTLVKITISLWNKNDVRALISSSESWNTIEERVIKKVSYLPLPQLLKEKVLGFIRTIGLEVYKWIQIYCRYLPAPIPAGLCWTPQGTVDRKRTAEVLVKDENLDIAKRYRLACTYCMEDDIIQFWNSMTEDLRESVSYKGEMIFWSRIMRRIGSHFSYKDEFQQCARWGNKVAAEYYLQKLTPTERKESLVETAKYVRDADTLCFLLSKMDEEQQMEVFKNYPYKVLECFLQWPFQSFFIEIASFIWDFLSKEDYYIILGDILRKIEYGYKDCNYQMLFREFWQKSPSALKSFITNEIHTSCILPSLFDSKDKENIRLILKDTTFTEKEKLICSSNMIPFYERSIHRNEWDFLEFYIREFFPSKIEMLKLKVEFEKRMCPYFKKYDFASKKSKWDLLFRFSDDSVSKCHKRSLEEGESSSSKQFRSLP